MHKQSETEEAKECQHKGRRDIRKLSSQLIVVALNPSIKRDMAKEAVRKSINSTDIKWESVDILKLIRHVSLTVDRAQVERIGLRMLCQDQSRGQH